MLRTGYFAWDVHFLYSLLASSFQWETAKYLKAYYTFTCLTDRYFHGYSKEYQKYHFLLPLVLPLLSSPPSLGRPVVILPSNWLHCPLPSPMSPAPLPSSNLKLTIICAASASGPQPPRISSTFPFDFSYTWNLHGSSQSKVKRSVRWKFSLLSCQKLQMSET